MIPSTEVYPEMNVATDESSETLLEITPDTAPEELWWRFIFGRVGNCSTGHGDFSQELDRAANKYLFFMIKSPHHGGNDFTRGGTFYPAMERMFSADDT